MFWEQWYSIHQGCSRGVREGLVLIFFGKKCFEHFQYFWSYGNICNFQICFYLKDYRVISRILGYSLVFYGTFGILKLTVENVLLLKVTLEK